MHLGLVHNTDQLRPGVFSNKKHGSTKYIPWFFCRRDFQIDTQLFLRFCKACDRFDARRQANTVSLYQLGSC